MITRREVVLLGAGLAPARAAWSFVPGEFWNDKQPSEWSEKDVKRLLTKSPWAKEASAEMNFANMAGADGGGARGGGMPGGRGGGPGMGGPVGGGPGIEGPGGPGGPGGAQLQLKAIVRWETAAPIRDASKRQFPRDPTGSYVLSVSGLPRMRRGPGEGGDRSREMSEGLRETTVLQRKGRDGVAPVHTEAEPDGTLLFYFSNDADPVSLDDKEVVFRTKMGPLELKVKFVPKEMRYRGKLAL
jgi:hypothetical protein